MSVLSLAGLLLLLSLVELSIQDKGSTPRIKEIVIGRCYDYQYKKFGSNATTWKNCSKIWDALHRGFAYKNPCNLTFVDYKPYFDEVEMAEIYNKVRIDFAYPFLVKLWKIQINSEMALTHIFPVRCSVQYCFYKDQLLTCINCHKYLL